MDKYKLISGEEINLETLRKDEIEHIGLLEESINDCIHHNETDYFYVHGKAFEPIHIGGSKKQVERLHNSPFYKVVRDMVTKYGRKCKVFDEEVK